MFSYLSRVLPSLPLAPLPRCCLPQCVPDRESPRFINEKCKSFFRFFFGFPVGVFFVSFIFWFFVRVAHIRDRGNVAGGVGEGDQGSHGRRAS